MTRAGCVAEFTQWQNVPGAEDVERQSRDTGQWVLLWVSGAEKGEWMAVSKEGRDGGVGVFVPHVTWLCMS